MQLSCPKCKTNFKVSIDQIGVEGRKVRCSQCLKIWNQKPYDHIKIEPIISVAIKNRFNEEFDAKKLPMLVEDKNINKLHFSQLLLYFFIGFLLIISIYYIDLETSEDPIQINTIYLSSEINSDELFANYQISNESDKSIQIPSMRIRLIGQNNEIIDSYIVDNSSGSLKAGEIISFKINLPKPIKELSHIDIIPVKWFDFILY